MKNEKVESWLVKTLDQEIICPFCFETFSPSEIRFRCIQPSTRCSGWENDEIYAKRRNLQSMPMGHVFEAKNAKDSRKIPLGVLRAARCDLCFTESHIHICPECHFELPHDTGQIKQYTIAIIGGTGTGKSHYIGSLIFTLKVERRLNLIVTLLSDETQIRWQQDFYNPVFERRTVLPGTLSARADTRVKVPLVLRLTSKDSPLERKLNRLWHQSVNASIFDAAGEDMAEFEKLSVENRAITRAAGLIFIVDPLQIESVAQRLPGVTATRSDPRSSADNMLDRMIKLFEVEKVRPGGKIRIPLAVVLSKVDILEPILDPGSALRRPSMHSGTLNLAEVQSTSTEVSGYLRSWLTHSFCDNIETRFPTHMYFGVSSLGKQQDVRSQLEVVEPLRVEEPFLWLLYKLGFVRGK